MTSKHSTNYEIKLWKEELNYKMLQMLASVYASRGFKNATKRNSMVHGRLEIGARIETPLPPYANAKTFSENARLLKEQYQNSIWTSSSSSSIFPRLASIRERARDKSRVVRSFSTSHTLRPIIQASSSSID